MISKQIKIGALFNYLNMFIGFGYTIFLTPFIIRNLGQEEYGLYSLIGAFTGYLSILQFGMGNVIIRYVAKYDGENNQKGKENFLAIMFMLHVLIAILILISGTVLIFQIDNIFPNLLINPIALKKAKIMLAILSISLSICSITNIFLGILSGSEQFIFPRLVATISLCGRVIATIAILLHYPTAVLITAMTASFAIFSGLTNTVYSFRKTKVKIKYHSWDIGLLKEALHFSFYNFLQQIMGVFYWNIGSVIIGMKMTVIHVAVYSVGIQLNLFALQLSNSINNLLLPQATKMMTRNTSINETTYFVAGVARIILMIYGAILLGFIFFGKLFIILWAGEEYQYAYYITLIVLIAAALPRIQAGMNLVMKAKNMHGFMAVVYVITSAVSIPIAWVFVDSFGILGVVFATSLSLVCGNVIIANIYYVKKVGLNLRLFIIKTFSGLWFVFLISALACYAATYLKGDDITTLLIQCTIYVIVYWTSLILFGLNSKEKMELSAGLNKTIYLFEKFRGRKIVKNIS